MPGATLPNTGVVLPSLGGDAGIWDDENNAAWANYDDHTHEPGKGSRIVTASINLDDDLSFNGNAATDVSLVDFTAIAALTSGAITLFVSTADHELYWRTNGGVNVKLTNGTSINTTLLGGIAGDYAAVGAELAYDDANDRYTFKQQGSPRTWAKIASADVRLYEAGTSETVYVGLKAPASLGASFDITMPTALPATQKLLQMDASGNVLASGVLANNENIKLQGTGYIQRSTRIKSLPVLPGNPWNVAAGSVPGYDAAGTNCAVALVATTDAYYPIVLSDSLERVTRVDVWAESITNATALALYQSNQSGGGFVAVTGATASVPSGGVYAARTITPTTPFQNIQGQLLWLRVTVPGSTTCKITSLDLYTDVP